MSKVEVEGDMNLVDDVSSSDSESESDNEYTQNEPPLQFENEEEESLEVFNKSPVKSKTKEVSEKPKSMEVSAPKLNEIVSDVKLVEPKANEGIDITFDDGDAFPDEFGITYKKSTPTKKINNISKPVETEVLFEPSMDIDATLQAMKASAAASVINNDDDDDDDEFGFDSPEPNSNTCEAIRKALESAAKRETVEHTTEIAVDNSDFLIQSNSSTSNGPQYQPIDEPILANAGHHSKQTTNKSNSSNNSNNIDDSNITVKKGSALESAKKAYQDVIEVYGGGMGDQEVLLLEENLASTTTNNSSNKSKAPLTAQIDKSVKGNVIEEGDEEEEEEEELLESTRQLELVEKNNQLQAEWDDAKLTTTLTTTTTSATTKRDNSIGVNIVNEDDEFLSTGAVEQNSSVTTISSGVVSSDYVAIDYKKALNQIKSTANLKQFESLIVISDKPAQQSTSWFSRSSEINYSGYSIEDLKLPFLIAQLDYEPSTHINMLRSIFNFCINDKNNSNNNSISATGPHWEKIGFQGVDPRTDLNRSMKLLSILQMLDFIDSNPTFVKQLHTLSGSADAASSHLRSSKLDTSWPFMCVAIMFTKESIQALRSGVLNAKCSKYENVMAALNTFHHSCFFEFYRLLTEQPAVHHAVHLATLRKQCSENPLKIMNAYRNHLKKPVASIITTTASNSNSSVDKSEPEMLTKFDNLESIDDTKGYSNSNNNSIGWSFGGKASKFQVK